MLVKVSGKPAERTGRGRANWSGPRRPVKVTLHVFTKARRCTAPVKTRGCVGSPSSSDSDRERPPLRLRSTRVFTPARSSRPAPELAPPRPLALPIPSPAARAEHCGTQTKCPQTGWSERSGNRGGAGPHARGGGSLPTSPSPPLTPLPLPHPAPPRKREPSPRSPNRRLPSANRPQRPPARGPPGPLAPPLRPPERSPPAASHSPTSQARRCSGPPCPCRRLFTGLGAAARDRVSSASRGRREGAGRALRPLPPGCRRHRRHHPLAASAWRGGGGGGGAAGLRALAPPPAGNGEGRAGPAPLRRPRPRARPPKG